MKGSTGIMLLKVVRHLFGILRAFEQWVVLESAAKHSAAAADSDRD